MGNSELEATGRSAVNMDSAEIARDMNEKYSKKRLLDLLQRGRIKISTSCGEMEISQGSCEYSRGEYLYEASYAKVKISVFDKGGDTVYRGLKLEPKTDLTLYRVDFITDFPSSPATFIAYRSFIDAPAAAFLRYRNIGFYTGVENPFFTAKAQDCSVCISFEPSLILKKDEIYESEPQFLGSYVCTGEYFSEKDPTNLEAVKKGIRRPRFFNPCGEIALDLAEIDAMNKYVAEYYNVIQKQFDNILYFFFYPKKQLPQTDSEVWDYLSTIDRFCEISGDIAVFNPHVNTVIPNNEKPYWELAPQNSPAERILRYAQGKGLRCGYYMGCAINGAGGNAALLPFMPEKTEWKKKDAFGNTASENCLGCDDYLQWWYTVQKNTIEKYDLGYWAWDPGPGNGNDCYAENHGHIPGKGAYKGWRNSLKLLKWLKTDFPKLFLMSFYGRKEYGIWGFRYFSQHEVYWEQTVLYGATLHNDISDDRINAHGTRLQNQWSMNFRFLPAHLGHGLVTRMGERWFDPSMDRAYDFAGWKYALLSAVACCGSVTHCSLPDCLDNVPGFTAFYRKWIDWAKKNYRFCNFTKPITDRVSNGVIDGFARIDGNKGQIFLFNSSPKILRKKLTLDQKIGLNTKERFYLKILYCEGIDTESKELQYRDQYFMGDILDITLPPYGTVVLELTDSPLERVTSIPRHTHTVDRFTDGFGNPFPYPKHKAFSEITLTAHAVFTTQLKDLLDASHIANEAFLMKKIPEWHANGMPFTFATALPHRLVMYIPFDGPKQPDEVKLSINDVEVPVEVFCLRKTPVSRYAFVETNVKWGEDNKIELRIQGLAENSFMGIYVGYPDFFNGICTRETVFEESAASPELYHDSSLVIDNLAIHPDVLSDKNEEFTVTVKTAVSPDRIENVYLILPTRPEMPALNYDPNDCAWHGTYTSGTRASNIFCNPKITAWIKAKDGGIGPRAHCDIKLRYSEKS